MGKIARLAVCSLLFTAACADDEFLPNADAPVETDAPGTDGPPIDADPDAVLIDAPIDAIGIDAPIDAPSSVQVINCPGNPDMEISAATGAYVFTPSSATISANGIVRFTPGASNHDMVSGSGGTANGLFATPLGQVTCLRFTAAGTFPFFCSQHGFTGTLTVQ